MIRSRCLLFVFLFVFSAAIVPEMAFSETEPSKKKTLPFDTPLAQYEDDVISLGYFIQYTRGQLPNVAQMEEEERLKTIENVIRRVFFEKRFAKRAVKDGIADELEYQVHKMDMENDWLSRFYVYHQFYQTFKPSEEDLKKKYEENKKDFLEPAKFSFRHIFFQTIDRSEADQKRAQDRANEAKALIEAGSDFIKVAQMYSDSSRKGEVIGPRMTRKDSPNDAINPLLEKTLLALKPGGVSEVIQTKYGYEILRLESLTTENYTKFETVRNKLVSILRQEQLEKWTNDTAESNWEKAVTVYNPELIVQEDADPDAVVFEIYGQKVTVKGFQYLKGNAIRTKKDESDEDYRQRQLTNLKEQIATRFILAKKARDLAYHTIPAFQLIVGIEETKKVFNVWWNRTLEKELADRAVTDKEKKDFYDQNSSRFKAAPKAHIGVMTFPLPKHDEKVPYEVHKAQMAAAEKGAKAIARVRKGEDFAKVAADMSAEKKWDLGLISVDDNKLPRAIAQQGISLSTGTVTAKPLKQDNVYYVLKCFEKPERDLLDFNQPSVQTRITNGLKAQKQTTLRDTLMNELADPEKIKMLYTEFGSFNPGQLEQVSMEVPKKE